MDLVMLVFAIVYAAKRPGLAAATPAGSPDVPADMFAEWKRLELLSRDIVIWVGFGWVGIEIVAAIVLGGYAFGLAFVAVPIALATLVIAAVIGSKAAKIKKKYGIAV